MAPAPTDSLQPPAGVDAVLAVLRRRGLRASASRRMIIRILLDASTPLEARQIETGPDGEEVGLDLASVYRNLETLEDHGLVQHIHAGRGAGRYVLAGREREFLACSECGQTLEVDPDELDEMRAQVRERFGFEVTFRDVPMVGRCPACAAGKSR